MSSVSPKVSVLLPAFDCAATLAVALESVRRQSEPNFECIVVDDGSRDETRIVAERCAARDARFRVLARPHRGLVGALNAGLAECRAPFIARMDGDDLMSARRLSASVYALEAEPRLAGVGTGVRSFPRAGLSPNRLAYERWLNAIRSPLDVRTEAFVECPIAHPTLTLRAAVLHQFGYRDQGWPEDYDLVLRLLAAEHELAVLPARLHHWRDAPGRYSRVSPVCALDRFVACKAAFLAQDFLSQGEHFILWGYGDTGKALCRALAVHGKKPSAIIELHPGRIGQLIASAPVLPPEALPSVARAPIIVSVAGENARSLIRAELARMRFVERRDFVVTA
jgi:hypothetical protein